MNTEYWRQASCWLLGAVIAANGVAATLRARNEAWRLRRQLTDSFVDPVSSFETEMGMAGLRVRLGQRDYVEYVTSVPNDRILEVGDGLWFVRFALLQYGIAPTVLGQAPRGRRRLPDGRLRRRFLLADFPSAAELDEYLDSNPCEVRWRREGTAFLRRR